MDWHSVVTLHSPAFGRRVDRGRRHRLSSNGVGATCDRSAIVNCTHAEYPWWGLALAISIPTLIVVAALSVAYWLGGRR